MTPYEQGVQAYNDGRPLTRPPFAPYEVRAWAEWRAGWQDAADGAARWRYLVDLFSRP